MQCVATIERHARAAVSAVTVYTREPKDACLRSAYSRSRKLLIDRDVESTWRPGRVAVLGHAICRRLARIGLRLGRLATVCLSAQHADTVRTPSVCALLQAATRRAQRLSCSQQSTLSARLSAASRTQLVEGRKRCLRKNQHMK